MSSSQASFRNQLILDQALENLGFQNKSEFTASEIEQIKGELDQIVVFEASPDDFIGDAIGGDALESLAALSENERYAAMARNLLRFIIRGTSVNLPGGWIGTSPFLNTEIIFSLFYARDQKLFAACQVELKKILANLGNHLAARTDAGKQSDAQYEMFLNTILAILPFIDFVDGDDVKIPRKINDHWQMAEYKLKKLDISPQTGPLSVVLADEDRIYAYGLEPVDKSVTKTSKLIFMGTTYPAGQGADLANLNNLRPLHSVGEGHDLSMVADWLETQDEVEATGHSMGATVSQIAAVKFYKKIKRICVLNPAPLSGSTLKRLKKLWDAIPENDRPQRIVFSQPEDVVYYIGSGFLNGTEIYRVLPESENSGYRAHIEHYLGRKSVTVVRAKTDAVNKSKTREFVNSVKSVLDWFLFSVDYAVLFMRKALQKFNLLCSKNRLLFHITMFALTLVAIGVLVALGILMPPLSLGVGLVLAKFAIPVTPLIFKLIVCAATAAMSVIAGLVAPLIVYAVRALLDKVILPVLNVVLDVSFILIVVPLASAVSGIVIGLKNLFGCYDVESKFEEKITGSNRIINSGLKLDVTESVAKDKPDDRTPLVKPERKIAKNALMAELKDVSAFSKKAVSVSLSTSPSGTDEDEMQLSIV